MQSSLRWLIIIVYYIDFSNFTGEQKKSLFRNHFDDRINNNKTDLLPKFES
jgi:hypothetical protein